MSVKIIVDSTADLSKEIADRIKIVPLTLRFGDQEYVDGVTISRQEFYEKLIESDILPQTSQATPDAFDRVFKEVTDHGDEAVVLTVASKLSGTFQSAMIAAEEYEGKIYVVDSASAAIGTGILAELALKLAEEGDCAKTIADKLSIERDNITIVATLDTLEYLKKGGRISVATAIAGGLLSIKPVVSLEGGEIKILGKARGSKQGNNLLVKKIEDCGGVNFEKPLLLGYTGITDVFLEKYMEDSRHLWEGQVCRLNKTQIGSVIGTHAGPGAVAVAFFKNK
ncbi:MAG: DegV family protein [Clostridia bacterium]|nr:DegV family protein [Clostridia bacterium]